jgi:hypothetical protein
LAEGHNSGDDCSPDQRIPPGDAKRTVKPTQGRPKGEARKRSSPTIWAVGFIANVDTPDESSNDAQAWLVEVLEAEQKGELLTAFDLAGRGLDLYPDDVGLRYRAVLALARTGATTQAALQLEALHLAGVESEDVASLRARIQKDRALSVSGEERRRLANEAAAAYGSIRDRTGGYFPAINAATLSLVAGDPAGARELARDALERVSQSGQQTYFAAATEAEALLLLGDVDGTSAALARASALVSPPT